MWTVRMRYEGNNKKAIYPDNLPRWARKKVLHNIKEGEVVCLLDIDKSKDDNILGARWEENFEVIEEIETEKLLPVIAPQDLARARKNLRTINLWVMSYY